MNTEKLLRAGMDHAIEMAKKNGVDIREPVSHPKDLKLYTITTTDCVSFATVCIGPAVECPPRRKPEKMFPYNELFNSKVAIEYGRRILSKKLVH